MAAPGGGITFTKNSMGFWPWHWFVQCPSRYLQVCRMPARLFFTSVLIQRMALIVYNSLTTFLHVVIDHHSRNEEDRKLIMSVR